MKNYWFLIFHLEKSIFYFCFDCSVIEFTKLKIEVNLTFLLY